MTKFQQIFCPCITLLYPCITQFRPCITQFRPCVTLQLFRDANCWDEWVLTEGKWIGWPLYRLSTNNSQQYTTKTRMVFGKTQIHRACWSCCKLSPVVSPSVGHLWPWPGWLAYFLTNHAKIRRRTKFIIFLGENFLSVFFLRSKISEIFFSPYFYVIRKNKQKNIFYPRKKKIFFVIFVKNFLSFFKKNFLGGKILFVLILTWFVKISKKKNYGIFLTFDLEFDLDDLDRGHRPSGFQMPISALVYLPSFVKFRLELSKLSLWQTNGWMDARTDGRSWSLYPPRPLRGGG
jgi:hypothetical protein